MKPANIAYRVLEFVRQFRFYDINAPPNIVLHVVTFISTEAQFVKLVLFDLHDVKQFH